MSFINFNNREQQTEKSYSIYAVKEALRRVETKNEKRINDLTKDLGRIVTLNEALVLFTDKLGAMSALSFAASSFSGALYEGQFSWMTHDTGEQIGSEKENTIDVWMYDNEGNVWYEKRYEGYGEFGGMDYYELVAKMNGYTEEDLEGYKGSFKEMRQLGIDLAFGKLKTKDKKGKTLFPALTTDARYNWKRHDFTQEADSDPNQSWYVEPEYDEYEDEYDYDSDEYYESMKTNIKFYKKITQKEWSRAQKDSKTIIDGVHYMMFLDDQKGTILAPVEITEGNAFGAARAEAIAKGEKEFTVDGETYPVEDVDKEDKKNAEEFANEGKLQDKVEALLNDLDIEELADLAVYHGIDLEDENGIKDFAASLSNKEAKEVITAMEESVVNENWGTYGTPEAKVVIKTLNKALAKFEADLKKAHDAYQAAIKQFTTGAKKETGSKSGFTDSEGRHAVYDFTMGAIERALGMKEWGGSLDYKVGWMYEGLSWDSLKESLGLTEGRSISKIQKEWGVVTLDMKKTVEEWKAAEGDRKAELLDKLKALTSEKKSLESELNDAVGLKDADAELAESLDEAKAVKDFDKAVLDATTEEEVKEIYPNAEFFVSKMTHGFAELAPNLFMKYYYTKGTDFKVHKIYTEKGRDKYVDLFNLDESDKKKLKS